MQHAFDDACVTGWRALESGIVLPDADDRHVVAAALHGRADRKQGRSAGGMS